MPETSVLDLTDSELLDKDIIRLRDVVPSQFWVLAVLGTIMLVGAAYQITPRVGWEVAALAAGSAFCFFCAGLVATVKVLFMLSRSQLEVRILATQLPREAASLVVSHMSPSGLGR
jgi:hypothetical protein